MNNIDSHILDIDKVICSNINKFSNNERGLLSQNILTQLRNFVEHISVKLLGRGIDIPIIYGDIKKGISYIQTRGDLRFLSRFHKLLQITVSHYTLNEENSERLMLKYYEYLLKIKAFLKENYNLNVLENISDFPISIDSNLKEYYEKIAEKINQPEHIRIKSTYKDRCYIQKIKPFFIGHEIYYEVTFTRANDYVSKFDRIIAFTKLDISPNYAVRLTVSNESINILNKSMPIQIIDRWEVSIRPCEIDNFIKIFGYDFKIGDKKEVYQLMQYLTQSGLNLVELIDFPDNFFYYLQSKITEKSKTASFFMVLEQCREIVKKKQRGYNVIRYLLYGLNNKIIKNQYYYEPCEKLSDLNLDYGCIPFDEMPFNSSLKNHNPRISDLFSCIDHKDREHEILARLIKNNTEQNSKLYTSKIDLKNFDNIKTLMSLYNNNLYYKHLHRKLEEYKNYIFIRGYENDTYHIINKLKNLASNGIKNYTNSVNAWLQSPYSLDCDEKKEALKFLFDRSKVALIYGAAGTGKSTMINHISNFFDTESKLYLTNTNPAVDNLKRKVKVKAQYCTFKTITKFLSHRNNDIEFDILIMDECSTVGNKEMLEVLNKASFKLLVLVGDIFQIESILYGNWFNMAKSFVPNSSIFELTKPYRTNNDNLLTLWDRVRKLEDNILECITRNQYSVTLDESIFEHTGLDEIILCLNYDGLYGINNINRFLQGSNPSTPIEWGTHSYKVDDPVLFNESNRFAPLIYNNLKGRIVAIEILGNKIQFDIEIDKVINEFVAMSYDFELMENAESGNSIIRFSVNKYKSTDEDDDTYSDSIVPFQVAYAVSIHKAQGLEYNSVKVVITDEVEEMISHNIFYTAITRAREKLKIYWTPETENKILNKLEKRRIGKDVALLKAKYNF